LVKDFYEYHDKAIKKLNYLEAKKRERQPSEEKIYPRKRRPYGYIRESALKVNI
jgi:hypothetical protein